jgi:pullulanase/glycogen debranching enzyme
MAQRVDPCLPHPLGATWDGSGVNFALFSANATRVQLRLFDPNGRREREPHGEWRILIASGTAPIDLQGAPVASDQVLTIGARSVFLLETRDALG